MIELIDLFLKFPHGPIQKFSEEIFFHEFPFENFHFRNSLSLFHIYNWNNPDLNEKMIQKIRI